jgi:hypothetical protein
MGALELLAFLPVAKTSTGETGGGGGSANDATPRYRLWPRVVERRYGDSELPDDDRPDRIWNMTQQHQQVAARSRNHARQPVSFGLFDVLGRHFDFPALIIRRQFLPLRGS